MLDLKTSKLDSRTKIALPTVLFVIYYVKGLWMKWSNLRKFMSSFTLKQKDLLIIWKRKLFLLVQA